MEDMPSSGATNISLDQQTRLMDDCQVYYKKKFTKPSENNYPLPSYLLNYRQPVEYNAQEQVEELNSGNYDLSEDENHLNKLRQAVVMGTQARVDRIMKKMGLHSLMKQKTQRENERLEQEKGEALKRNIEFAIQSMIKEKYKEHIARHDLYKDAVGKHQKLHEEDMDLHKNVEKKWAYETMAKPVDMRFKNTE